jgi:hypothetical protein
VSDILLSQFRESLLDGRDPGAPARERRRRVFVDREGRIVVGDEPGSGEGRRLSEVHRAVFAGG